MVRFGIPRVAPNARTLHSPLRPPEAIFEDRKLHVDPSDIDWYMAGDVWALGCTVRPLKICPFSDRPVFSKVSNGTSIDTRTPNQPSLLTPRWQL